MIVTACLGHPGAGKSTLFKKFIEGLNKKSSSTFHEDGLVKYHFWEHLNIVVFGIYEKEQTFVGLDLWSMASQPVAEKWIKNNKDTDLKIFFEGDRLSTPSFFRVLTKTLPSTNLNFFLLEVSEKEKKRRYQERKSDQSEQFLRSRITKYENLKNEFNIRILPNENEMHLKNNLEILNDISEGKNVSDAGLIKTKKLF